MWWAFVALAAPEDAVQRLLDTGKIEAAQKKCERISAWMQQTSAPLREVCATAMWPRAEAIDSFSGWVRYGQDWAGTARAALAHEREAGARLRDLGETAEAGNYATIITSYPGTEAARRAEYLQASAEIRGVSSAEAAKRVVEKYPDHEGLLTAILPFLSSFVVVETNGDVIHTHLEPALPAKTRSDWAGKFADGSVVKWEFAAARHLEELGLPKALVHRMRSQKPTRYPLCSAPNLVLGVEVTVGKASVFSPVPRSCAAKVPGFFSVRDGSVAGLTLQAGIHYRFPLSSIGGLEWVHDELRTLLPVLGEPRGDVLIVGPVVGKQVGANWMLFPLAGGMPWYVKEAPPPDALPLLANMASMPVPERVRMVRASNGDVLIEKQGAPGFDRSLPAGEVRVMTPIFQEITGLHDQNAVFRRMKPPPLPVGVADGGAQPVALPVERRDEIRTVLGSFGVQLVRAWQVQLASDLPMEIVFEGRVGDEKVKGVLDPRGNTKEFRLFVFHSVMAADPIQFRHAGATYIGWRQGEQLEALHFEPRGLIRTWTRP